MKKRTTILLFAILLIALIPLYYIGIYDHPSVDDYFYGVETSAIWTQSHSVSKVLQESFVLMKESYTTWQGNFAAIFLMRLQPAIFGDQFYVLTPIILISTFVFSMILFITCLLNKIFKSDKYTSLSVAIIVTLFALEFTYMPSDSFYWFNGSIYYTFFFSLMLILFTLTIILITAKHTRTIVIAFIPSTLLAFLIGGGNYATALFTVIILFCMTMYLLFTHQKNSICIGFITLSSLFSLIVSMIAPGNAIRQATVENSPNVIKALLYSFAYGAYNIANATTVPVIVMWICLIPIFYKIVSKNKFTYPKPLLFFIFTFCVYCSQGTPVFYAQGLNMPYRMMNIIYFSYYIFATINLLYFIGWLAKHYNDSFITNTLNSFYNSRINLKFSIISIAIAISCIGQISINKSDSNDLAINGLPLTLNASYALITGNAQQYDNELSQRDLLLSESDDNDIIVPELSIKPSPIFHTDITDDPTNWKNAHLSLYYNKHFISTQKQE